MMRSTANNKLSKLVNYMLNPIRILKKARQLYMKGVEGCAGGIGYGGGYSAVQISHLRQSFNVNSRRASGGDEQGPRTVPMIRNTVGSERRLVMHRQIRQPNVKYNGMKRNSSIGLRKMRRIDEDKPCHFEEDDQIDMKTQTMYPRSRSNVVFYK